MNNLNVFTSVYHSHCVIFLNNFTKVFFSSFTLYLLYLDNHIVLTRPLFRGFNLHNLTVIFVCYAVQRIRNSFNHIIQIGSVRMPIAFFLYCPLRQFEEHSYSQFQRRSEGFAFVHTSTLPPD